jgi:hypothetical protein
MSLRKKIRVSIGLFAILNALFVSALLMGYLPADKDGYRLEYTNGQVFQVKDFVPPSGTVYMTKEVNGQTVGYYGMPSEK